MEVPPKNPACFLYGPETAKFANTPYPSIEDQHDVIIRIAYVGVCGSDVCSPPLPSPKLKLTPHRYTSGLTEA